MAKFYGPVGFIVEEQGAPDVTLPVPVERNYKGDLEKIYRRIDSGIGTADDLKLSNRLRIVADAYLNDHFYAIRYVKWRGAAWKVTDIEVQHPSIILTLGGVYNGEIAGNA